MAMRMAIRRALAVVLFALLAPISPAQFAKGGAPKLPKPFGGGIFGNHREEPPDVTPTANDIDPEGPCKAAIESLCGTVSPGDSRVAECLRSNLKAYRARKEANPMAPECRKALGQFWQKVARSPINAWSDAIIKASPVTGFREACTEDIQSMCSTVAPGKVMACLKFKKSKLTPACREKIFKVQQNEAADFELDPEAADACRPDIEKLNICDVSNPPGAKAACLMKNSKKLSEECRKELFRREQESSSDIRLNLDVLKTCQAEVSSHCKDADFGEARMFKCLWHKSLEKSAFGFSEDCRSKVQKLAVRSSSDYRLDFTVREQCSDEIDTMCSAEKKAADQKTIAELFGSENEGADIFTGKAGGVLQCLKKNFKQISGSSCQKAMTHIVQIHGFMWSADPMMKSACSSDVLTWCAEVPAARVHLCLRNNMKELSPDCKDATLLQGSLESMDISMKPLLLGACKSAVKQFCANVPPGEGKVLQCLQESMDKDDFPWACKTEVEDDLEASNHDWRLKFGVHEHCKDDVESFCAEVQLSGGHAPVLTCLKENLDKLKTQACQTEVREFAKVGIDNIKFAPVVNDKCMADVQLYCAKVEPGGGRVHECLRRHGPELSQACASAEFALQVLQASDVRLSKTVSSACGTTIKALCSDVKAGSGAVWACLEDNIQADDMTSSCRAKVSAQMTMKHGEFHLNLRLAKVCTEDARTLCPSQLNVAEFRDFSAKGQVITCLTARIDEIQSDDCKGQLRRKVAQRVEMRNLDPELKEACQADMAKFCSDQKHWFSQQVAPEKCLVEHEEELQPACKEKMKVYSVAASKDIRMNTDISKVCAVAIRKLCSDVGHGGKALRCLLTNMHHVSVDSACREALAKENRKRTRGIEFNPLIQKFCSDEVKALFDAGKCDAQEQKLDCLTRNSEALKSTECQQEIANLQLRQSADLRVKPGMMEACKEDKERLCPEEQYGGGRVQKCMREYINEIQNPECKKMVTEVMERDRKSASVNFDIQSKCQNELEAFCQDVSPGMGQRLACLGLHMSEAGFSEGCKGALKQTAWKSMSLKANNLKEQFRAMLDEHRGFLDRWGGVLLVGTIGFVVVVTFFVTYWLINKRLWASGYSVVVPKDLES